MVDAHLVRVGFGSEGPHHAFHRISFNGLNHWKVRRLYGLVRMLDEVTIFLVVRGRLEGGHASR